MAGRGRSPALVVELNGPIMMARIGLLRALNRNVERTFDPSRKETHSSVFIYVNTSKQVGDAEHLKVFANVDAAETWLEENDPEGEAFEYEVLE